MDRSRREMIKLSAVAAVMLVAGAGCDPDDMFDPGKKEDGEEPKATGGLAVTAPKRIDPDSGEVVLTFSREIDPTTVSGRTVAMKGADLQSYDYRVSPDPQDRKKVRIVLKPGVRLRESWKYSVEVGTGVRSLQNESLSGKTRMPVMTESRSPFVASPQRRPVRSKIVVISDIHMGEQRGADEGYSLFTENVTALTEFLEQVRRSETVRELVILGDMMDIWIVPMAYETLRGGIADAEAFYRSVAAAPVNRNVVDKLNRIADEGHIRLTYVPGNHDMSLTQEIFEAIFPNGHWKGTAPGTGVYWPEAPKHREIVLEHGHNYDLFNAPDPLTTYGSLLPPGYFISRIYATRNLQVNGGGAPAQRGSGRGIMEEFTYLTGWQLAVDSMNLKDFDPDRRQIVTGYGGYTRTLSPNEARDIYTDTIDDNWEQRQRMNGVYEPESFLDGALNGTGGATAFGSLETSAQMQYFKPDRSRIAVFGHTHTAMLVEGTWNGKKCIYANSGTWVDTQYLDEGALNRTCVVVDSAHASGSDLHNVTVFRYEGGAKLRKLEEGLIDTTA